ncbi:MAG: bifunctional biotin--[acetyl-CoA-carboxylase] ligase/biotin operon repressor BirA [Arsenophonus sp.]|nr:MAG: bifunctional biotin--[acetyl-CoA-carboxylase] ligase/biotin operon repressor BirA [Arsenophonus sp.]
MNNNRYILPLKLIKILSNGSIYSKKELSKRLGIIPEYIKDNINILKKWGIEINTFFKDTYFLNKKMDFLNSEKIYKLVKNGRIIILPIIHSTNQYLIECIEKLKSGDVCIAEYQTNGRGRRGRFWNSPFGYNLYLSLYWNFQKHPIKILGLNIAISTVIAETLNKLLNQNKIQSKWPNDIYLNEKKLAGILIEIIKKIDNSTHIIVGVGLNIKKNKNSILNTNQQCITLEEAGIIIKKNIIASKLILKLRYTLLKFEKHGLLPFVDRWLKLDKFLNKTVSLHIGKNHQERGMVKGINEYGAILLEQKGKITTYLDGEISLRSN